jgi:hypothetical protein
MWVCAQGVLRNSQDPLFMPLQSRAISMDASGLASRELLMVQARLIPKFMMNASLSVYL